MRKMIRILCKPGKLLVRGALMLGILVSGALVPGTTLAAQEHTDTRSERKVFPVSREYTLEVQNKYGKIEMVNWERDEVAVEVDIHLTESSASKLRKLKEQVSIQFSGAHNYIIAKSSFGEGGRIASELKSVGHAISGSNKHVEINYTVYLPDYLDVVLSNKYGDIYLDDLDGQVEIDLSNGVMKANSLNGQSSISLSFANGMIETLGSSNMKLIYSDLTVGDVGQLDLESKSSKVTADSINVLKINSRRDKFHIQQVEYLYGKSNFSQVWIYDFLRESDVYMKYGKLTIEHVIPEFSKIFVESEFTDVSLYFDEESTFAFDILHHEKGVLRLPGELTDAEESLNGKDHLRTMGSKGGEKPQSKVTINALQKCYINLSIK